MGVAFDSASLTWSINKLNDAVSDDVDAEYFIKIPKFQRAIVWNEKQKRELIESLYRGFPVGALLMHESGVKDGRRKTVQLVDGLQRTTAITSYLKEPLKFASVDALLTPFQLETLVQLYFSGVNSNSKAEVSAGLKTWLEAVRVPESLHGFDADGLAQHLDKHISTAQNVKIVRKPSNIFKEIIDEIQKQLGRFRDIQLPVIMYSGDTTNLPDIFERINSRGTQLSKYQIFAATWVTSPVHIENSEIVQAITAKYQDLVDQGYELWGYDEGSLSGSEFNLFEYLFGLGRHLSDKFPILFQELNAVDETSPVGFVIATVAHRLKTGQMASLPSALRGSGSSNTIMNLKNFEDAVLKSCKEIVTVLKPYVGLNLNQISDKRFIGHSQNQIISIVVRYMVERFDAVDWSEKKNGRAEAAGLLETFPSHYLFDIIKSNWQGSGDNRLWDVCWSSSELKNGETELTPSLHYWSRYGRDTWTNALEGWHDDQLQKQQKLRPNIAGDQKVFLKFVYSNIIGFKENLDTRFEIEHIYPVARLSEIISETIDEPGWPISVVSNLALLDRKINGEKGKDTAREYIDKQNEPDRKKLETDLNRMFIMNIDDIKLGNAESHIQLDKDLYIEECQKRFAALSNTLFKALHI